MKGYVYEKHELVNLSFPVLFHYDELHLGHKFSVHWHENIEILFMLNGHGTVTIEDTEHSVKEGDIIVVNSNRIHHVRSLTDRLEYYCLIIDKDYCDSLGFNLDLINIDEKFNDDKLFDIIAEIAYEVNNKELYFESIVTGNAQKILANLFRNHVSNISEYNSTVAGVEMIKRSIEYIKKHYSEKITLEDIVEHIGYNKFYFCRTFKKMTGVTVNAYINNVRIQKASAMLVNNGCSVNEAASKCGFNDISYFTKVFKKRTNMMPSKFKSNFVSETNKME